MLNVIIENRLENVKPQVIYWCYALYGNCENNKENLPEKNFMSAQRSLSSLY